MQTPSEKGCEGDHVRVTMCGCHRRSLRTQVVARRALLSSLWAAFTLFQSGLSVGLLAYVPLSFINTKSLKQIVGRSFFFPLLFIRRT